MRLVAGWMAVVLLVCGPQVVTAADADVCADNKASDAAVIAACTRIIDSKSAKDKDNAYYNRAVIHGRKSDHDKAIADATKSIDLAPKDQAAWRVGDLHIDAVLLRGQSYAAKRPPQHDQAIADFSQVIKLSPRNVQAYLDRAESYAAKGAKDQELADYRKILDVTMVTPWRIKLADENARSAEKVLDGSAKSRSARGRAYAKLGEPDNALVEFSAALVLEPTDFLALIGRGDIYAARGTHDLAVADYTKAIAVFSKDDLLYSKRAASFWHRKEHDKALADYSRAIELDPKYAEYYHNRGSVYAAKGDRGLSIADYNRAIELAPKDASIYRNRASSHYAKGDRDLALADYNRAIELEPTHAPTYRSRGLTRRAKGDLNGAIADYTSAIMYNPQYLLAFLSRGIALAESLNYAAARSDFETVLKRPDSETAHARARDQLARLGAPSKGPTATAEPLEPAVSAAPAHSTPARPVATAPAVVAAATPTAPVSSPIPPVKPLRRVALIIGNANYKNLSKLGNPVADAKALQALLERHGFQVLLRLDLDFATFDDAMRDLKRAAATADEIVVFYAGHGLNDGSGDLIAPVDFDYTCPDENDKGQAHAKPVYSRGVPLSKLTGQIGPPTARRLIVVDACSNAPLLRCPVPMRAGDGDDGQGLQFRGLERANPLAELPMIVSSTQPGTRALDGRAGEHSPFLKALLKRFQEHPGTRFGTLMSMTTKDVITATKGRQVPQVVSSGGSVEMCLRGQDCKWEP
jgi:tetratricopeptide (TPR) repeat protein